MLVQTECSLIEFLSKGPVIRPFFFGVHMKFIVGCLLSFSVIACPLETGGLVPHNDLKRPIRGKSSNGVTEIQFKKVISDLEAIYIPVVKANSGTLQVISNWSDSTVNAYALRYGSSWTIQMFGGLARHEKMTIDAVAIAMCHELGHHLAGFPKYDGYMSWASSESQSDYFASAKCLRKLWAKDDNQKIMSTVKVPVALEKSCASAWAANTDYYLCLRSGMANLSLAGLFADLSPSTVADFATPDSVVVTETNTSYPSNQCRLDTFLSGSLCEVSPEVDFSQTSEVLGACHADNGHKMGLRPACWFAAKKN